jgi:hypothetical protein
MRASFAVALLFSLLTTCGDRPACESITDWNACEEASHCSPTHEDPADLSGPSFSCLPRER